VARAERGSRLTPRERQVTVLVAQGLSPGEIARKLSVSRRTVESHLFSVYGKTGTGSRVKLALWLQERRRGA
jgi:DNA-binding CsgD family transcriptional regulator